MLLSTLSIMLPIHLQNLRLAHPTVKEEVHLQKIHNSTSDLNPGVKDTNMLLSTLYKCTHAQMHAQTDGRRTEFGMKLTYPFSKKSG